MLPLSARIYGEKLVKYFEDLELYVSDNKISLDLDDLIAEADKFANATDRFQSKFDSTGTTDRRQRRVMNDKMMLLERQWLTDDLPVRKGQVCAIWPSGEVDMCFQNWYKHAVYAPKLYGGYEGIVFTGVSDSLDSGDFEQAQIQIDLLVYLLKRAASSLK